MLATFDQKYETPMSLFRVEGEVSHSVDFQLLAASEYAYSPVPMLRSPAFAAYESSIYSIKAKETDRQQLTRAENAELDATITSFLRLLSPYYLLKPAQKALEYLVRRFRINVRTLILATKRRLHWDFGFFFVTVHLALYCNHHYHFDFRC